MDCTFKITRSNLVANLKLASQRHNVPLNNYINFIYGSIDEDAELTDKFKEKLSEYLDTPIDKINSEYIDLVVKFITDEYNKTYFDVNYSANNESSYPEIAMYGYNSVYAREFAKHICLSFTLDFKHEIEDKYGSISNYIDYKKKTTGKTISKLQAYTDMLKGKLIQTIVNRANQRGIASREEALNLIRTNKLVELEELFGKEYPEDVNLLATYKEFRADRSKFIEEVFRNDGKLRKLVYEKREDKEIDVQEDIEEQADEEGEHSSTEEDDVVDNYIGNLTNKMGDVGHYMSNINNDVILFFSTISKLKSVNKNSDSAYQYDTDNPLGVPDVMDAAQCINTILTHADAHDVNSLIKEIERIARDLPGMEGLVQVADYMKSHHDFAFKLWCNFSKTIISKLETSNVSHNGFTARQSNYTANKETVLKFDFINSFKISAVTADKSKVIGYINELNTIKKAIDSKYASLKIFRKQEQIDKVNKEIDNLFESAVVPISKAFKVFFNTIQEQAIETYVARSNDKLKTINFLLGTLNSLTNIATATTKNYNAVQDKIKQVNDKIYELNAKIRSNSEEMMEASQYGININTGELRRQNKQYKKEVEKLTNERDLLYKEDFIDGNFMGTIAPFARKIARYSNIKTDLNSRNVNGNLSSDLINNSMITNIMKTLRNPTALANFGKYRSQSKQYDFSNIMIEHRDENGEVINYGLFTQDPVSKELTPTTYAHRLLQAYLYSGISDADLGIGSLYKKMPKSDYIVSAIFNFFKHENEYNDEDKLKDGGPSSFANYFMRIPSDAPKNFVIRAPRYSISSRGTKAGLYINGKLNTDHPIYKQLRNAFVQEMQDAANALDVMFPDDVIDGAVSPEVIDKNISTREFCANYHYKGKLFERDKDGKYKLTGNVFGSDRFKVTKTTQNEKGKYVVTPVNYGQRIVDEAFDFFYGGANSIKAKRTTNGVEIIITPHQEEVIAKHLEEFLKDYSEQCYERAIKYKDLFGVDNFNKAELTEFAINYLLTYINCNDLFEGDTKLYKTSQDTLKRFKETQGSGVSYGMLNYNDDLSSDRTPVEGSALNETTFTRKVLDENNQVVETPISIKQYNRFRGVTIKNTVRTGDSIGTFKLGKNKKPAKFIKSEKGEYIEDNNGNYVFDKPGRLSIKLIDSLVQSGMSRSNAMIHAANVMAGYFGTTVNDAQSYITFEEWVRRIAGRGQLEEYKDLIDAIYDETKPLDSKTIKKFVQVQKNFYYDQYYKPELRLVVPRQIKNAEFVLIPRLIKGTQLEEVYNMMQAAGIDQLNTEETYKAGKSNILTIWNDEGEITEKNKEDFITNASGAAELFNYNYLYTQQETPSHLDSENKAGIQFMKKIIDNIPPTLNGKPHPLYPLKEKFQKLYTQNIISSAEDFADEIGMTIDENGNIVIDEDNPIDVEVFYELLRDQISRQGLDSNSLDYVTLNKDGFPVMPTFVGSFNKKLESIVQSMINNRITRQTLPGFHAAQITNIGFRPLNTLVEKRSYSTELKYHPDQYQLKTDEKVVISEREYNELSNEEKRNYTNIGAAPYIEIMLPKSAFKFKRTKKGNIAKTDKELLDELRKAKLDTVIGYRIPTEGKQSICVMKVVGFIDDAYDSTIVVPDDWVSQTGSDFDIDSVYGINYSTEIDSDGHIAKATPKQVTKRDYIRYIKRKLGRKLKQDGITTIVADDIQKFVDKYNIESQDRFNELQAASDEIYDTMKYKLQNIIKGYNKVNVKADTKREQYINKLKYVLSQLAKDIKSNDELSRKEKTALRVYYNSLKETYDFLNSQNEDFFEQKEEVAEKAYDDIISKLNKEVVKFDLPDFNTFSERKNRFINRNVRNNELLDIAIDILQSDYSLEENLSRSNFEKLIEARDAVQPKHIKEIRDNRSPYNFFDQADYQEDSMGGATLKGASVARDTFVSICNAVRPYIVDDKTIKVVYKKEDGFTKSKLQEIFPDVKTDKHGNFVVTHNTIGWTKNNKNIDSLLLTPYTSQTTAHILDAIKEGAIPNVNNYTFNVYKTFPDIGCDFYLTVAFMMQPAVARIVEVNNAHNSLFGETNSSSPIKEVIIDIANKLMNGKIEFTMFYTTYDIIKAVSEQYKQVLDYDLNGHVLDFESLNNRLNDDSETVNNLLFDLKVVLDFQHIRSLSNAIGDNAKVLNPDKYGAKQTVFDTIDTINTIDKLRHNTETIFVLGKNDRAMSLMDAVYPIDDRESLYPPLNAFYKYSTQLSVQLARLVFDTHREDFDDYLFSIGRVLNVPLDNEKYDVFRNYVINYAHTNSTAIKYTPIYNNGSIDFDITSDPRSELTRIYGLSKGVNLFVDDNGIIKEFEVADINNPTLEEINQFITLSPAQKVHFIKNNSVNAGIFDYIEESLSGRGANRNKQTITYKENVVDIETIYSEFEKAFFNDNPLIKLAAIDVVKYAYAVNGVRFKKGAVNKVIKNNVLYLSREEGGLGIVDDTIANLQDITNIEKLDLANQLRLNFIRSHANAKFITVKKIKSHKTGEFYDKEHTKPKWEKDLIPTSQGIIVVNSKYYDKYNIAKVVENDIIPNNYIVLIDNNVPTLYKINFIEDSDIILTPLNTLEENEYGVMSINNENNRYNTDAWYDLVIEDYTNRVQEQINELSELHNKQELGQYDVNEEKAILNNPKYSINASVASLMAQADLHKYMSTSIDTSRYAKPFDINSKDTPYTSGFEKVIDAVRERFEVEGENLLILRSPALKRFINYSGEIFGSVQTINDVEYKIQKLNYSKKNKDYIKNRKPVREVNKDVKDIFTKAQSEGKEVNDAFAITKANVYSSTTDELSLNLDSSPIYSSSTRELNTIPTTSEFNYKTIQTMYHRRMALGDESAAKAINFLDNKGIGITLEQLEHYKPIVTQINSEYITNSVNDIIYRLNNFEVNGQKYRIDSDEVINAIKTDRDLREKFLKTILDARAFVDSYSLIEQLDITAEDPQTAKFLKKIKDSISKLRSSNIVSNAEIRMGNDVLAKLSNNPLIQKNILGIFDGYHSATLFDAWVNDLQETSNPLLQLVSKEVMTDIHKAEMTGKRESIRFKKALNDLKVRASRAGVKIDWDHIFDEDGKFIQKYNKAFLDKLQELRDKKAKAKLNRDKDPKSYYEAAIEFEKWKAENLHQEADPQYYKEMAALDEYMIKHHAPIYIKYRELTNKIYELYNHVSGGVLEQNYVDELKKARQTMDSLTSDFIFDGDIISSKYSYSDPDNSFTGEDKAIYSIEASIALRDYRKQKAKLQARYFQYDAKNNFDKELEENLAIINEREKRDPQGRLITPTSVLMLDEEYVKAKKWIANNTTFTHNSEKFRKLQEAFAALREGKDKDSNLSPKLVTGLAKKHNAYDEYGVVDASKFTDEEREAVRKQQEIEYDIKEQNIFSDRTLITNAPEDDTIFSADFYNHMRSNGADNPKYLAIVKEINNILRKHYYAATKSVHTSELTIDELNELSRLYDQLNDTKKHVEGTSTNGKSIAAFIKNNVDFIYDHAKFAEEENRAKERDKTEYGYYRKWLKTNTEIIEDEKGNDKLVPNHYLYGYAVPKGYKKGEDNPFIDKKKTEALRYIRENTETVATEYYHQTYREMYAKGQEEFEKWFNANHIYNPYTHTLEPIRCWTTLRILNDDAKENYSPNYNYTERKVITGKNSKGEQLYNEDGTPIRDMTNPDYIKGGSYEQNYNGTNSAYNNPIVQNEYEKELSDLVKSIIEKYAITPQAKKFFKKGYAPIRRKNETEESTTKKVLKELVKFIGWVDTSTGKEDWLDDSEVDYGRATPLDMPMTTLIKSKDSVDIKFNPPKRKQNETDDEYNKRYEQWYKDKQEGIKKNREINKNLLDRNWDSVLEDFIVQASKFNAIQKNQYIMFYAKNMIDNQQVYIKNLGFNKLQKTGNRDITGSVEYATKTDDYLKGQYVNWIRRILYEQYKKPNNRYTKVANLLQSYTSSKYMMFNILGGIANVTQGWNQVLGERFARDYFGSTNWWKGVNTWNFNIASFIYDMYKDTASSTASAVIKFFGVVDQESINGAPIIPDAGTYVARARDITFSPLGVGEHFLQNSALFTMLYSHRIYFDPDAAKDGKPSYTFKSEGQARNEAMDIAFRDYIRGTKYAQLYDEFVEYETSRPDYKKEYVTFREDLTSKFAYIYFNGNEIKQYEKLKSKKEKEIVKEFNDDSKHPTIISQLTLGKDGYLAFTDGSLLATKLTEDEAMQLLASFKGRVLSVNKKIHGVYTKLGAAQLENKWLGSLVMQYHKHIPMGLMKRWRRQGYFNEERGTVEKGTNIALLDFLAMPLHKDRFIKRVKADNNVTDEQLKAVEGIQNICKSYIDFFTHFTLYYNLLPRHEQANILRGFADFASLVAALAVTVATQCLGSDDDDEHNLAYDFFINQADRLATESIAFRSFGLIGQSKKLWSSPLAAQGWITDTGKTLSYISQYIIQGDDFETEYTSGSYAGENKLSVLIKRNIPMYHGIYMIERLNKNNKYYKLDENILSVVPTKPIVEWIKD